uniref:Secreted protein n=1 Tax=Setaria italica TaxID=4555 RepID=K3Y0H7_SETIT
MSALMICSLPQIVAAPTATTLFAGGRRNELQCSQIQGPRVNTISVTGKVSARTTSCVWVLSPLAVVLNPSPLAVLLKGKA